MVFNRNQRRALKRNAPATSAILAASCFDFLKDDIKPITHPKAIGALRRAFRRMLEAGGQPMAFPLSQEEACGFPNRNADHMPGAVTWLAVGVDVQGRGAYALRSALSNDLVTGHEVARTMALSTLRGFAASPASHPLQRLRRKAGPHDVRLSEQYARAKQERCLQLAYHTIVIV